MLLLDEPSRRPVARAAGRGVHPVPADQRDRRVDRDGRAERPPVPADLRPGLRARPGPQRLHRHRPASSSTTRRSSSCTSARSPAPEPSFLYPQPYIPGPNPRLRGPRDFRHGTRVIGHEKGPHRRGGEGPFRLFRSDLAGLVLHVRRELVVLVVGVDTDGGLGRVTGVVEGDRAARGRRSRCPSWP